LLGVGLLSGCKSPDERMRPAGPAAERGRSQTLTVGKSVEGRPIECVVFGDGRDVILILSTIHGNESAGTPLLRRLAEHLTGHPDVIKGRKIVLMPLVNPDGLARSQRYNVHDIDLNRNFPASNYEGGAHTGRSALSEPESTAIFHVIGMYHPNRIVSLHQPANHGNPCIDYDGPADSLALAMAARCDLPVKRLGCQSGSLGSYAGVQLGVPIVTVELPRDAGNLRPEVLWDRYGQMLLTAIAFPGPNAAGPAKTAR
jgi:protein MpaA